MDDERLWRARISDLFAQEQHAEALALLDERIPLVSPNDEEVWLSATACLGLGRPEEAVYRARRVGPGPHLVDALFLESAALLRLGRMEEALHAATEAARLRPGDSRVHQRLAAVLIAQQDPSALESAQRAVAADGSDPGAYYVEAVAHVSRGEITAAEKSIRRTLERDPGHADALALRESLSTVVGSELLSSWRLIAGPCLLALVTLAGTLVILMRFIGVIESDWVARVACAVGVASYAASRLLFKRKSDRSD